MEMLSAVAELGLNKHKAQAISFASAAMKAGKIVKDIEVERIVANLKSGT